MTEGLTGLRRLVRVSINVTVLTGALLLVGCGGGARQTFDLGMGSVTSPVRESGLKRKRHLQILIADPDSLKALDGQEILVRGGDGSIGNLKGAQWSDRLPAIVQARIAQIFEDTRMLGGVGRPGDGLAINYQIISDIRMFGIDLEANGKSALVEIAVKIVDDKSGNVLRTQVFSARNPVKGSRNTDYARALDKSFAVVLADIVSWTFASL